MLFRILLILNVLLASVQGAPIRNRPHRLGAQSRIRAGIKADLRYGPCSVTCGVGTREVYLTKGCPENMDTCFLRMEQCEGPEKCRLDNSILPNISQDTLIKLAIAAAIIFVFAITIGVIFIFFCCYRKKNKPRKDVEGQWCDDDVTERNTKLNARHVDDITITTDDSPHGPMDEQRDKISVPGPDYVIINIDPDEDVDISSDRDHEVKRTNTNEDVPHGPMAEKADVLNDTKINMADPSDTIITISPDGNVVVPSDRDLELCPASRDIMMQQEANTVEMKKSEIKPDLNDYKQSPQSILKGRNQMKNKNKGNRVSFQELDHQYVYIYEPESSEPGHRLGYFRKRQEGDVRKCPRIKKKIKSRGLRRSKKK